jgi:hypothetical protein
VTRNITFSVAFPKKKITGYRFFFKANMKQKEEETNVKRWGLQMQKVGIVEETRGEVAGTEVRWQHGMGNRIE